MFHSYVNVCQKEIPWKSHQITIKLPFSYGFPMVFSMLGISLAYFLHLLAYRKKWRWMLGTWLLDAAWWLSHPSEKSWKIWVSDQQPWLSSRYDWDYAIWDTLISHYMVGGFNPSEKYESVGMMKLPRYGKIKVMFQSPPIRYVGITILHLWKIKKCFKAPARS